MLRLTVLGSGDAFNAGGSLHSCYLLEQGSETLLLECGPSVLAAMRRFDLDPEVVDAVAVSHLHGDHFAGIPFLLLEYSVNSPRRRPLVIAGPPTTAERIERAYASLYSEARAGEIPFEIDYRVLEPGSRFQLAGLSGEAFEVPHGAEPFCLGYRLEGGGSSLLFSGDSAWTEAFVEKSRGVDLFLCECCSLERPLPDHLSYGELIDNRARLGCKRLLLTHLGAEMRVAEDLALETADDGLVVELP